MKRIATTVAVSVSLITAASAQFSAGNLAVVRVGDGSQALANTGNSIFVDQFTVSGSFVNSVAVPDNGVSALIVSGTATAEGALVRSADGQFLTLGGYNTTRPYGSSLPATAGTVVQRGVGQINQAGTYSLVATTPEYSTGALRASVTDGAGNYWGIGTGSATSHGTYYFGTGMPVGFVEVGATPRVGGIVNGNLAYTIAPSTGTRGVVAYSGLPTSPATASVLLDTGSTSSPYDFAFNPSMTVAYVTDDRTTAGGGIQRFDYSGGAWSLSYTLSVGTSMGSRALAVDFSSANPVIYAITTTSSGTAPNNLITITDTGASSPANLLATAPAGTVFRGLDFAPVPEPGTWALLGVGLLMLCGRVWTRRQG